MPGLVPGIHGLQHGTMRGGWVLTEKGVALVESWRAETSGTFVDHLRAMPDAGGDEDFAR